MTDSDRSYVGRFAPSPSGPLHFGSLVAALGSYLDARQRNGRWLVRIEDLDPPREKPGAADHILRTLEAFGFQWDGEVLYQSHRVEAYREALDSIRRQGLCYPCGCTRKEINSAAAVGIEGPRYPGTCRGGLPAGRNARAIRMRTDNSAICFHDRIYGRQHQRLEQESGDFIIRRADGPFAYQLAVVVDDAFQDVTQIVRGADLLGSTPRQLYLQHCLGYTAPGYAHLPLVVDETGRKLSKQSQDLPVDGSKPIPALLEAMRFLNQPLAEAHPATPAEFWQWSIAHWDIARIEKRPA
ncbi:MAG: tRNA glutamyl-Q(34) synthetase GluQRS [Gammaproteobacteria bacterium]|nr:tRNA glutamyl-Q(34) synthetase GluQRS [Gammaproteobacteria bacterium]